MTFAGLKRGVALAATTAAAPRLLAGDSSSSRPASEDSYSATEANTGRPADAASAREEVIRVEREVAEVEREVADAELGTRRAGGPEIG